MSRDFTNNTIIFTGSFTRPRILALGDSLAFAASLEIGGSLDIEASLEL